LGFGIHKDPEPEILVPPKGEEDRAQRARTLEGGGIRVCTSFHCEDTIPGLKKKVHLLIR
jgi:hypothetical protein